MENLGDFEDDLFEASIKASQKPKQQYAARQLQHRWFDHQENADKTEALKFSADCAFLHKDYLKAVQLFEALLASSNSCGSFRRELLDSITRCYAHLQDRNSCIKSLKLSVQEASNFEQLVSSLYLSQFVCSHFQLVSEELVTTAQLLYFHPAIPKLWMRLSQLMKNIHAKSLYHDDTAMVNGSTTEHHIQYTSNSECCSSDDNILPKLSSSQSCIMADIDDKVPQGVESTGNTGKESATKRGISLGDTTEAQPIHFASSDRITDSSMPLASDSTRQFACQVVRWRIRKHECREDGDAHIQDSGTHIQNCSCKTVQLVALLKCRKLLLLQQHQSPESFHTERNKKLLQSIDDDLAKLDTRKNYLKKLEEVLYSLDIKNAEDYNTDGFEVQEEKQNAERKMFEKWIKPFMLDS